MSAQMTDELVHRLRSNQKQQENETIMVRLNRDVVGILHKYRQRKPAEKGRGSRWEPYGEVAEMRIRTADELLETMKNNSSAESHDASPKAAVT